MILLYSTPRSGDDPAIFGLPELEQLCECLREEASTELPAPSFPLNTQQIQVI